MVEAGVAIVKTTRPPDANRAMYMEPADIFSNPDQLGSSERAIGLAAEGNQFCAGNDLTNLQP